MRVAAAHQHRRMRFLYGFRPGHEWFEIHMLAMIFRFAFGADQLDRRDAFAHHIHAFVEFGAMISHFLGIPSRPDAKQKPPSRKRIQVQISLAV